MPLIKWDESFSVGNEEIDQQHLSWVNTINNLHEKLIHGSSSEMREIALISLKSMRDYTRTHFPLEEEYMKKIGYPDLQEHKQIHDKFYVEIMNYYNDIQEGKIKINTQIMSTLMGWLQDHILNEDKKYADFAARRQ